jgi:hypothetical protein
MGAKRPQRYGAAYLPKKIVFTHDDISQTIFAHKRE